LDFFSQRKNTTLQIKNWTKVHKGQKSNVMVVFEDTELCWHEYIRGGLVSTGASELLNLHCAKDERNVNEEDEEHGKKDPHCRGADTRRMTTISLSLPQRRSLSRDTRDVFVMKKSYKYKKRNAYFIHSVSSQISIGKRSYAAGVVGAGSVGTVFFAYFLLYRSTRPAESTSFCLPV
jgi:hypothetical protein